MKNRFYEAAFDGCPVNSLDEVSRQHQLVIADTEQGAKLVLGAHWSETSGLSLSTPDHYGVDGDQPVTCPECGVRTEFDEIPGGHQGHQCLGCGYLFTTEFEPEDN